MSDTTTTLSHILPNLHILRPRYLGYIRSAGQAGLLAFESLVLNDLVPVIVKVALSPEMAPHERAASLMPIEPQCERDWYFDMPNGVVQVSLGAAWRMGLEEYSRYCRADVVGTDTGFLCCYYLDHIRCIWDPTRHITQNYLFDQCHFNTVDLIGWENVSEIGDFFMAVSPLRSVDLSAFRNVTTIGTYFLAHTSITSIDLSPLGGDRISCIPAGFLQRTALTTLDLTPFTGITSLSPQILNGCIKLETIVFGNVLRNERITHIPDDFLLWCTSLKNVRIHEIFLPNTITTIGVQFMKGCASIAAVDLTPFGSVVSVGHSFMEGCKSLEHIDVSPILQNSTVIQFNFLANCEKLRTLKSSPLIHKSTSNVTRVDASFLNMCVALEEAELEGLRGVTSIDQQFMSNCRALKHLDLEPLSEVTSMGATSLFGCLALESIDLRPLHRLSVLPTYFMAHCPSLVYLDLSPLTNIKTVEAYAFWGCKGLTSEVDLSPWFNVQAVRTGVLEECGQGANWGILSHVTDLPPHVRPPPSPPSLASHCCVS